MHTTAVVAMSNTMAKKALLFLLIFLASLTKGSTNKRLRRQASTCGTNVPSHLMASKNYDGTDQTTEKLRCLDGKIFSLNGTETPLETIECDTDPFPTSDSCIEGAPCKLEEAPTYEGLEPVGEGELDSGTSTKYACTNESTVLQRQFKDFAVECFNGKWYPLSGAPSSGDSTDVCIVPSKCLVSEFTESRSFMESLSQPDDLIEHGQSLDFKCKENRTLASEFDPDEDNKFNVPCYNGLLEREFLWPESFQCHSVCSDLSYANITDYGFVEPEGEIEVLSGSFLNLTCENSEYVVNDSWTSNILQLKCLHSGDFEDFEWWPTCMEKQSCGYPPKFPVNSALRAKNESIEIPDYAIFKCREEGKVTDIGPEIKLQCMLKPGETNVSFTYPKEWGTNSSKCREAIKCKPPFAAPLETGLTLHEPNKTYYEFGFAKYKCKDSTYILWKDQQALEEAFFEVQCGRGGVFQPPPDGWPLCDSKVPDKCDNFPEPPDIVEIINPDPQLPGGKVFYKCKEEGFISNIGDLVEVECVKHLNNSVSFSLPNGWNNLKCRSKVYPDFREDPCICPGDQGLDDDMHRKILEICYENEELVSHASMNVPMKKRCGVGSLENVTKENLCHCSERKSAATDFAIWSRVELTNFEFHQNFTEPKTLEFQRVKKLFEKEIDKAIISQWTETSWRYVRSKVITFMPSKPQSCSIKDVPEPPDGSGLALVSEKAIKFGEYAHFTCAGNETKVTDQGFVFKILCLTNGKFQPRKWDDCRPQEVCTKTPPRPLEESGLGRNYSRIVKEFENATYECIDPNKIVEGTEDGLFRVMCKRRGIWPQAAGKYGVEWPECKTKPTDSVCDDLPQAPDGYVDDFQRTLYVTSGTTIAFKCAEEGFLAGDAAKLYYRCEQTSSENGTTSFAMKALGHDQNDIPTCRAAKLCDTLDFPTPHPDSGIGKPFQTKDIKELEYVEYSCEEKGQTWSLSGEYKPGEDFEFDSNVEIIGGKLRIQCALGAILGSITKWPKCRDTRVQGCDVGQTNPELPSEELTVDRLGETISIGDKVLVRCTNPSDASEEADANSLISDAFVNLELPCEHDGLLKLPADFNMTSCRPRRQCGASPQPPEGSNLEVEAASGDIFEHEKQAYACKAGFTLEGVQHPLMNSETKKVEVVCITKDAEPGDDGKVTFLPPTDWTESVDWPTCLTEVETCTELPSDLGNDLTNVTSLPVTVGNVVSFECIDPEKVTYMGRKFDLECTKSGQFEIPSNKPYCRAPLNCPQPPIPSNDTRLLPSKSVDVKEWSKAHYQCRPGTELPENTDSEDGNFTVLCGSVGQYPAEIQIPWPTCDITHCVTVPEVEGFKTNVTKDEFVPVGDTILYSCANEEEVVNDTSLSLISTCQENGEFSEIEIWPVCRKSINCKSIPQPPAFTNLLPTTATEVFELNYANYTCKNGSELQLEDESILNGQFRLQCQTGGSFGSEEVSWPNCTIVNCTSLLIKEGFTNASGLPVAVGERVKYRCQDEAQVTDLGPFLYLTCGDDGSLQLEGDYEETWPQCRAAEVCTNIPEAPTESNLNTPTVTSVKEFQHAFYQCKADGTFGNDLRNFTLECPLGGEFDASEDVTWPTCVIQHCIEIPSLEGFVKVTQGQVEVGKQAFYACLTEGQVTDLGRNVGLECRSDGTFDVASAENFPACRDPVDCLDTPHEPDSSTGLTLTDYSAESQKEFQYANYHCQEHFSLPDTQQHPFKVLCGLNGTYPENVNFPSCIPTHCTGEIPSFDGFVTSTEGPVEVETFVSYTCQDSTLITNLGASVALSRCDTDGQFMDTLEALPECRAVENCVQATPPNDTNLEPLKTGELPETDSATFKCKDGYDFEENNDTSLINENEEFSLSCLNCECSSFPEENYPICIQSTSGKRRRKKRFIVYEGLREDITYSLNVIFETQWMFSNGIKNDIALTTNVSFDEWIFPKTMIDVFHDRIEAAIGDEDKGALKMKYPIHATCEQPMTTMFPKSCVNSFVTPTCSNEKIESPWLKSLGFVYQKQEPNWLWNSSSHNIPVGGSVEFYCENILKRPKKDAWDSDAEDGIISAFCTHNGDISITMSPGDWDRCRRLCPVQKPKPPLVPGAQLRFDTSEKKDDIELWEDDTIRYECTNDTLVIDGKKGVFSVSYKCMDDGTYATPKGEEEGDPWPECTLKPVDPFIIDAIVLLTGKFDRNLVYRQALANTSDTEPDSLDIVVAVIGITIPTMGAIVAFIFLCMCFTRADSPICKVFEPQA